MHKLMVSIEYESEIHDELHENYNALCCIVMLFSSHIIDNFFMFTIILIKCLSFNNRVIQCFFPTTHKRIFFKIT